MSEITEEMLAAAAPLLPQPATPPALPARLSAEEALTLPELAGRLCYIVDTVSGSPDTYWLDVGMGSTTVLGEAHVYTIAIAIELMCADMSGASLKIQLVPQAQPEVVAKTEGEEPDFAAPEAPELELTRAQLEQDVSLRHRRCLVRDESHLQKSLKIKREKQKLWYLAPNQGYAMRSEAFEYRVMDALRHVSSSWNGIVYEILPQDASDIELEKDKHPAPEYVMSTKLVYINSVAFKKRRYVLRYKDGDYLDQDMARVRFRGMAGIFDTPGLINAVGNDWGGGVVEVLPLEPVPEGRKCLIQDVFKQQLIKLLELAPSNPICRGQILRALGTMPPEDCTTYEKLKQWVENTYEPKVPAIILEEPKKVEDYCIIEVRAKRTEVGRCFYSQEKTARIEHRITVDFLDECIDQGLTMTSIMKKIKENALEDALSWNSESPVTGDLETEEVEEESVDIPDQSDVEDYLWGFIRSSLGQETVDQLRDN